MRRMLFLLTLTVVCTGCMSQNPTSLPSEPVGITSTPIHSAEPALPVESPAMLPTLEEQMVLPEYLEMPCWQVPVSMEYETLEGWSRYINPEYCFTFTYPSDWTLVASRHFIALSKNSIALVIGVRRYGESTVIQRTGVGAGDIENKGTILFFGKEVSKEVLIYEGRIKDMLFQNGTEILADDLAFAISGGDFAENYELAKLEDEEITIFDQIVNSFQRIQPMK